MQASTYLPPAVSANHFLSDTHQAQENSVANNSEGFFATWNSPLDISPQGERAWPGVVLESKAKRLKHPFQAERLSNSQELFIEKDQEHMLPDCHD